MRKAIFCGCLLGLFFASVQTQDQQRKPAAGAKAKPAGTTKDKGPTLEETMNWIVNSLSVRTSYRIVWISDSGITTDSNWEFKLTRVGMCSLRVVRQLSGSDDDVNLGTHKVSPPSTFDYNVNLADLDPTSTAVKPYPPGAGTTYSGQGPVQLTLSRSKDATSGFSLLLLDESLANRGKAALIHAIELCGGKKSAF